MAKMAAEIHKMGTAMVGEMATIVGKMATMVGKMAMVTKP